MPLHPSFKRIEISQAMQDEARYHALRRTNNIQQRFVPLNPPLSQAESNFIGVLGEIVIRNLFLGSIGIKDNYAAKKADSGDIIIHNLSYDIKSEAVPMSQFKILYEGAIQPHEPYGCRVYTATHAHHLVKYTGGVIFVAFPIPDNSRENRNDDRLREDIITFCNPAIITGYVKQEAFKDRKPQQFSPPHPKTRRRLKYNSSNFVFHHSELSSIQDFLQT